MSMRHSCANDVCARNQSLLLVITAVVQPLSNQFFKWRQPNLGSSLAPVLAIEAAVEEVPRRVQLGVDNLLASILAEESPSSGPGKVGAPRAAYVRRLVAGRKRKLVLQVLGPVFVLRHGVGDVVVNGANQ